MPQGNPQDLELALRVLRKAKVTNHIQTLRDGVEVLELILCEGPHAGCRIESGPKVILLDLKISKVDGFHVLHHIKADPRDGSEPIDLSKEANRDSSTITSSGLGLRK